MLTQLVVGFALGLREQLLADVAGNELCVHGTAKDASPRQPCVVEPVVCLRTALLQDPVVADQIAAILQFLVLI